MLIFPKLSNLPQYYWKLLDVISLKAVKLLKLSNFSVISLLTLSTHCCMSHHVAVDQDTDALCNFAALFKSKLP